MAGLSIIDRFRDSRFFDPVARGYNVVYRANENNRCPGCGHAQWYVGRTTAECGVCGTALALAEVKWSGPGRAREGATPVVGSERRRHERVKMEGQRLQLLVDGLQHSFAIRDISENGVQGEGPIALVPDKSVHVGVEGGVLVPAVVRWSDGNVAGLAFSAPALLDFCRLDSCRSK